MDDALGFIKQKLNQGLSDVENWGSDVGNDVTHAVKSVFGLNTGAQPQQQAPQAPQSPQQPQGPSLAQQIGRTNLNNTAPGVQNFPGMNNAQQNLNGNQPKPINIQQPNISTPRMVTSQTPTPVKPFTPPSVTPIKIANMNPNAQTGKPLQVNPNNGGEDPNSVMKGMGNFLKGTAKYTVSPITAGIIDPIKQLHAQVVGDQQAYNNAERDAVNDNPFAPVAHAGQMLGTALAAPSVEKQAQQTGNMVTQTEASMPGANKNDAEAKGKAYEAALIQQLMQEGGVDPNESTSHLLGKVLNTMAGATAPLAFADVPDVNTVFNAIKGGAKVDPAALLNNSKGEGPPQPATGQAELSGTTPQPQSIPSPQGSTEYRESPQQLEAEKPPTEQASLTSPNNTPQPENVNGSGPRNADAERTVVDGAGKTVTETQLIDRFNELSSIPKDERTAYQATQLDMTKNLMKRLQDSPPQPEDANGFGPRNADAERAAIDEYKKSGDLRQATLVYAKEAGVDPMTALTTTSQALQEARILKASDIHQDDGLMEVPEGAPPKTAKAAQDIEEQYLHTQDESNNLEELRRNTKAEEQQFSIKGDAFEKAVEEELTPEERQAVRDNLEGSAKPEEVTPKIEAVTQMARRLNEMGANVLESSHREAGFGRLKNYATRLYRKGLKKAGATPIQKARDSLMDFLNPKSGHGLHRMIQKFVADDGETRYGTQESTGIHKDSEGNLVSGKKVFRADGNVPTRELEENGFKYERNYGKIGNEYHTSVGRSKARFDALQQVIRNPEKFGIHDEEMPGDREVTGIGKDVDTLFGGKFISKQGYNLLKENFGHPTPESFIPHMLDKANRGVQNLIMMVANVHVINQMVQAGLAAGKLTVNVAGHDIQSGPLGIAQMTKSLVRYATDSDFRKSVTIQRLRDGGHVADYGSGEKTVITGVLDKMNLPHANKVTSGTMSAVDNAFRAAIYDAGKRMGNDGKAVNADIDHFMGDDKSVPTALRYTTIFYNYLKTTARAGVSVVNIKGNYGATANFALMGALYLGLQAAYRDWTGNKHATIHAGGTLGLVKDVGTAVSDSRQHNYKGAAGTIINHVNPMAAALANQAYGEDLRTGVTVGKGTANGGQGRMQNLEGTLISPSQYITKVNNGKASIGQEALQLLTGSTLPHTKGAPAAPNLTGIPGEILNTKGAKAAPDEGNISDKTGIDQANAYYNTLNKGRQSLNGANDAGSLATFNKAIARNKTDQGQTIQLGPAQSASNAADLYADDKGRNTYLNFQKSQPNHEPVYDLSPDKYKTYVQYEMMAPGSADRTDLLNKNPWIKDTITADEQWFNNNAIQGNSVKSDFAKNNPYPTMTPEQNDLENQLNQLSSVPLDQRTPDQEQQYQSLMNNPQLQAAFQATEAYTNAERQARGYEPINYPPAQSPAVTEGWTEYNAIPKGQKTSWINAHQDLWNQMQNQSEAQALFSIEKGGALAELKGNQPTSSFLGSIYNVGHYDIAKGANGNGTSDYSLNPSLAYSQGKSGSGSGSSSQKRPYVAPLKHNTKGKKQKLVRLKKVKPHQVKIKKSSRIHINKTEVLKPTKIGHPGPLKIG